MLSELVRSGPSVFRRRQPSPWGNDRAFVMVPAQSSKLGILIAAAVLLAAAALLFTHLGHYALWDDEAMDALSARGILRTGDTTAVLDRNIVAYRGGLLLKDMRHQAQAPLAAYMTAASMLLFGQSTWTLRLLPALCGLASVALIFWWMRKEGASLLTQVLVGLGLLGNVSFLLYSRQCQYYAAGIFLSILIVYLYLNWRGERSILLAMGVASALLMADSYSYFVALYLGILVDFLLWRSNERRLGVIDAVLLFVPQVLMGVALVAWWNPFDTDVGSHLVQNTFEQKLLLFYWNWRDLNRAELGVGLLLLIAPFAAMATGNRWLQRALVALFVYVSCVTLLSVQPVKTTVEADVRYMPVLIALCIAIEVLTIRIVTSPAPYLAIPLAVIAFGTNLFHGGPLLDSGFRSTIAAYVNELIHPPGDPYTVASRWINEHVSEGESILAVPEYTAYPLMFHSPHAVYAWQLKSPPARQFANLDPIHFQGQVPPDYVVVFGPAVEQVTQFLRAWRQDGVRYERVATLDHFWKDMHRPELFWRTFQPIHDFDRSREAIYIFRNQR